MKQGNRSLILIVYQINEVFVGIDHNRQNPLRINKTKGLEQFDAF